MNRAIRDAQEDWANDKIPDWFELEQIIRDGEKAKEVLESIREDCQDIGHEWDESGCIYCGQIDDRDPSDLLDDYPPEAN